MANSRTFRPYKITRYTVVINRYTVVINRLMIFTNYHIIWYYVNKFHYTGSIHLHTLIKNNNNPQLSSSSVISIVRAVITHLSIRTGNLSDLY